MRYFQGVRYQRGHGLGSVFSSLFRSSIPYIKSGAKYIGKELLHAGLNSAQDIIRGDNAKLAVNKRFKETKQRITKKIKRKIRKVMNGKGKINNKNKSDSYINIKQNKKKGIKRKLREKNTNKKKRKIIEKTLFDDIEDP